MSTIYVFEELNQKQQGRSGLEEALVFQQLVLYHDMRLGAYNSSIRYIKKQRHYMIYDLAGNPVYWLTNIQEKERKYFQMIGEGITINPEEFFETFWSRFIPQLNPEGIVDAIKEG